MSMDTMDEISVDEISVLTYHIVHNNITKFKDIIHIHIFDEIVLNELLILACTYDRISIIITMQAIGADIHCQNCRCIKKAAFYGRLDTFIYLYQNTAFINLYELLYTASSNGKLCILLYLESIIDINMLNNMAMRCACEYGHLNILIYMHQHGGDIRVKNDFCLRKAAQNNHLDIVKYLVSHGANIHTQNNYIINYASKYGNLILIKYLIEECKIQANINKLFIKAVKNNHLNIVKYYISLGVDIRSYDDTAIKYAYRVYPRLHNYLSQYYTITQLYQLNLTYSEVYMSRVAIAKPFIICYNSLKTHKLPIELYTKIIDYL